MSRFLIITHEGKPCLAKEEDWDGKLEISTIATFHAGIEFEYAEAIAAVLTKHDSEIEAEQ